MIITITILVTTQILACPISFCAKHGQRFVLMCEFPLQELGLFAANLHATNKSSGWMHCLLF